MFFLIKLMKLFEYYILVFTVSPEMAFVSFGSGERHASADVDQKD